MDACSLRDHRGTVTPVNDDHPPTPDAEATERAYLVLRDGARAEEVGGNLFRTDAHPVADLGERTGGDLARLLGTGGEGLLERRLVGTKLGVALAHRGEQLDRGLGDGLLEVAVAPALEPALDLDRSDAARDGENVDQVGDPRLVV